MRKRNMYIEEGKIDKKELFSHCKFSEDAVTFQQCIESIINKVNESEDEKEKAINQLKEWNKDEELKKIRKELNEAKKDIYRGFAITEIEDKSISNWINEHDVEKHGLNTLNKKIKASGCIGGKYIYSFIPTSIGTIGTIKCTCGDEFTFRDL